MAIPLDDEAIKKLMDSLDPPDWVQMRLMASLSPAERVLTWMAAAEFAGRDIVSPATRMVK